MDDESQRTQRLREIEEIAQGWGELLAKLAFPGGVGVDVDLWTMEETAVVASKALVRGAIEAMTATQAESLESEVPCPKCGESWRLDHRSRTVQVRGGDAAINEPVAHCSTCRRDFFPSAAGAEARFARF